MALDGLQTFLVCYACVSMTVYVILIVSIFYQRKTSPVLRGSFFQLVIHHFVADVILFLEFNVLFRGRKYGYLNGWFEEGSPSLKIVPRISTALHYYIKIVVYIGQVIFALNRLTSAMFPMNYNTMWSKKLIYSILCVQWIVPLAAVLPINLNMNFVIEFVVYPEQHTLRLVNDPVSTDVIAYIDMGCSLICTIISLVMYAVTLHFIRKALGSMRKVKAKTERVKPSTMSAEMRLLMSALIVFIVLSFNTVCQVLTVITNKIGLSAVMFINDLSYPMVDLIYTCQPWALLFSSSIIRQHFGATLRCRTVAQKRNMSTDNSLIKETDS